MTSTHKSVWVFNGQNASFPCAIFSTRDEADNWIQASQVSGVLTEYPLGISTLDWAVSNNYFNAKSKEITPRFIEEFTSARQIHVHYENGICDHNE